MLLYIRSILNVTNDPYQFFFDSYIPNYYVFKNQNKINNIINLFMPCSGCNSLR